MFHNADAEMKDGEEAGWIQLIYFTSLAFYTSVKVSACNHPNFLPFKMATVNC